MASNIFSQTTSGEVNFQMITEPLFNPDASSAATDRQNSGVVGGGGGGGGGFPQPNQNLLQAIKMHHTKKFQINFSQINPLPIVDEAESSLAGEPRTGSGARPEETSLVQTGTGATEAQLVLSRNNPLVGGSFGFNAGTSGRLGDMFSAASSAAAAAENGSLFPHPATLALKAAGDEEPKRQYSTYIELAKSESRSRLINRSVYVDPSPSGITRIHINHLSTNSSVTEKIKEVNEKLFKLSGADEQMRAYQRQNDSTAHESSYISTYKKNGEPTRAITAPQPTLALTNGVNAQPFGGSLNSNNNNSRVIRFNLPNSPVQNMPMHGMSTQTSGAEPLIKLIPSRISVNNQRYEEIVNYKRDSSTSPFRIMESKTYEVVEPAKIRSNLVSRSTEMSMEERPKSSQSGSGQQQHYRKASVLSKTQPTYHEMGTNTTLPNSRVETVVAVEEAAAPLQEPEPEPAIVIHRKDSVKSSNGEIYSRPKVIMPRLERSKLIVVNLTPHPELEKASNASETSESRQQRSALRQVGETIEEEDEEAYPETREHRAQQTSGHHHQQHAHLTDSNQELHQSQKTSNLLTPTSTKSIAQQTNETESIMKLRSGGGAGGVSTEDGDNILNGKSSNYYNDIRNKGSEMVTRTDSRRSRTKDKLTKLDFDQQPKSSFSSAKTLRRISYVDENGEDEENNAPLSEDSEINFFSKLRFYRLPNNEGQIVENFDYDQEPKVFFSAGKGTSHGSLGFGGLKRLNPITEHDEMHEQLIVDPVLAAQRFYTGEKPWPVDAQMANNPVLNNDDEIILMKEPGDAEAGEEGAEPADGKKGKKKKNLKVKIKLPTENFPKLKPKKQRHLQKCCLVLFLLTLFVIVTGILLYFFVYGYVQTKN